MRGARRARGGALPSPTFQRVGVPTLDDVPAPTRADCSSIRPSCANGFARRVDLHDRTSTILVRPRQLLLSAVRMNFRSRIIVSNAALGS